MRWLGQWRLSPKGRTNFGVDIRENLEQYAKRDLECTSVSSTYCDLGPGARSNVTLLLVDLFTQKFSGFRSMDSRFEISREISFWHCRAQLLYLKIIDSGIYSFADFTTSFFKWPALV